ncbi:hypothetical protein [Actinoplanes sp. NPDC026670]|uniref:hypothetical protein n=1 Tax=Actinoplanes sp. NPDC026670 TaxID=3154700 RepID=UPI0034100431
MAIEDAVKLIKIACKVWSLGYDQFNRLDFRDGGETDCSALVIIVCERSGLLNGNDIRRSKGATYTGNMRAQFKRRGWRVLPNLDRDDLRPGDVLLADGHHTAMFVGGNKLAQASIDERGEITGGDLGNRTGRETVVRSYYDRPWSCVLRFRGTAGPVTSAAPVVVNPGALELDGVIGAESARKLRFVLDRPRSGVIDRPTVVALQRHIGAPDHDGVISNQNSAAVAAHWPALRSFTVGPGDSDAVRVLQARLGVTVDGELGPKTARALQKKLNTGHL